MAREQPAGRYGLRYFAWLLPRRDTAAREPQPLQTKGMLCMGFRPQRFRGARPTRIAAREQRPVARCRPLSGKAALLRKLISSGAIRGARKTRDAVLGKAEGFAHIFEKSHLLRSPARCGSPKTRVRMSMKRRRTFRSGVLLRVSGYFCGACGGPSRSRL